LNAAKNDNDQDSGNDSSDSVASDISLDNILMTNHPINIKPVITQKTLKERMKYHFQ
jgi:hypothetical protein